MPRLAVVGDQLLTTQAVSAALAARGFATAAFPLTQRPEEVRRLRRAVAAWSDEAVLLLEVLDRGHVSSMLRLIRSSPQTRWLLLWGVREEPHWGAAIDAGAAGVLPVTVGLEELAAAVRGVGREGTLHSARERRRLVRAWESWSEGHRQLLARLELLTPREGEVLESLRQGMTVTEVSEAAGVSVDTVRSQVRAVLHKLDVPSQLAAVALLQRAIDLQPVARRA
ncbi:helix-turn-helix transcriptional regulator [Nocardioides daejeonensis]|uniref:helix-turn-helix transcriptional regulator n=1 Tax=Nocardioides daejeonensis TaxID=1046556 RepID=UPI0013A59262|nr:LuxR C-terminal-related transcriptional regulator [Nocardioides daejeonensis]